ncbi:MAG: NAD(P)-binding domain-containing protein [Leptolinea sp.]
MLRDKKFYIIGMGNIGKVLTQRLLAIGVPADQIVISDTDAMRSADVTAKFGVKAFVDSEASISEMDMMIIATPPNKVTEVLRSLDDKLRAGQVVISMAAAVPLEMLRSVVNEDVPVVRVLPNPPSMLGQGMNPVAYAANTPSGVKSLVEEFLGILGKTMVVRDDQMTWCVGLAGAAMRSVLPVIEGMMQAGIEAGLSPADARIVAAQIMLGTATLALETDLSFEQIKSLTPMETVDEKLVASLFLEAARAAKEKVDKSQAHLMGV